MFCVLIMIVGGFQCCMVLVVFLFLMVICVVIGLCMVGVGLVFVVGGVVVGGVEGEQLLVIFSVRVSNNGNVLDDCKFGFLLFDGLGFYYIGVVVQGCIVLFFLF